MYIKLNNQEIYYQKLGSGKDLIMLHGWKQDVSTFHNVAEVLKKHFTLWLIDLPGFGRSEAPKKDFTVSDYAEIIKDFILDKKLKWPNLLGHSVGGNIAIKFASENGELIDKLILESSSGIRPKKTFFRFVLYVNAKVFKYLVPNFFNIKLKVRRWLYWKLESDYLNAGFLKNTLTNILDEDLSNVLGRIKNNTFIIWGENDEQVKLKYGRMIYKLIPNSRIEILENTGHFPHTGNPKMFLYWVIDFLS
ncbi:alpha/beta hydrolase [Candidatus Daviesbacteria bacterium]|nr:alpha/beta hydrolase [Candidatus Daviesbacteria bacterium]